MHLRGWSDFIDRLLTEDDLYVQFMGDQLESIAVDDFRYDPEIHDGRQKPLIMSEQFWQTRFLP